jgi:hypothetical protein
MIWYAHDTECSPQVATSKIVPAHTEHAVVARSLDQHDQ